MSPIRKKLMFALTIVLIVSSIVVIILEHFIPYAVQIGNRISGNISIYANGEMLVLEDMNLLCAYNGKEQKVKFYQNQKGKSFFSINAGKEGYYLFAYKINKKALPEQYQSLVTEDDYIYASFEIHNEKEWNVAKVDYKITLFSEEKNGQSYIEVNYTYLNEKKKKTQKRYTKKIRPNDLTNYYLNISS